MESRQSVNCGCGRCETDYGPKPFIANIMQASQQNRNFRTAFWTGKQLQMTLMSIPAGCDIGAEMHSDTDQFIRMEEGTATVQFGECREKLSFRRCIGRGEGVFVPCEVWHNIINSGNCPLKLSSVYAPPHHPEGTVQCTKRDAEKNQY